MREKYSSVECLDAYDGETLLSNVNGIEKFFKILKEKTQKDPDSYNRCLVFLYLIRTHQVIILGFQKEYHPDGYSLKTPDRREFAALYQYLVKTCFDIFGAKHINSPEYDPLENSWKLKKDKQAIYKTLMFIHNFEQDQLDIALHSFSEIKLLSCKFSEMIDDLLSLLILDRDTFIDMYKALAYI